MGIVHCQFEDKLHVTIHTKLTSDCDVQSPWSIENECIHIQSEDVQVAFRSLDVGDT